jgi:hypothetical protein
MLCYGVLLQIVTLWLRNEAVETIMGLTGDEFSLLSADDKIDIAQQHRSGGHYRATVCCERPTGDFNKGQPVLYCSQLQRRVDKKN